MGRRPDAGHERTDGRMSERELDCRGLERRPVPGTDRLEATCPLHERRVCRAVVEPAAGRGTVLIALNGSTASLVRLIENGPDLRTI